MQDFSVGDECKVERKGGKPKRHAFKWYGTCLFLACFFLTGCTGIWKSSKKEALDVAEGAPSGEGVGNMEAWEDVGFAPLEASEGLEASEDPENPAGRLQEVCGNVMVQIHAGNLYGSGVIYGSDEKQVWIATAAHVLEQADGAVRVTFADGFEAWTSDVRTAREQDVALLAVPRDALWDEDAKEDHGAYYRSVLLSQEEYDKVQNGDRIIAMGSRSGVGEDAYGGVLLQDYVYLEDFGVYMMVADVYVKPGMSGGGLFDARGNFLGILCGVAEDGEVAVAPMLSLMAMEE